MSVARSAAAGASASASTFLSTYFREAGVRGADLALRRLCDRLRSASDSVWADCIRQLMAYDPASALQLLQSALSLHAAAPEVLCLQGQSCMRAGDREGAELAYRRAVAAAPDHDEAAFAYARLLREDGRTHAAASVLMQVAPQDRDLGSTLATAEFLAGCGHREEAYSICLSKLASQHNSPRLQLEAGTLALALGRFTSAEAHLRAALYGQPPEWGAALPLAMCRRYESEHDPDLILFGGIWTNLSIPDALRQVAGFALGKALDDIGDYAGAASALRAANELARREQPWSARNWHDYVDVQLRLEPSPLAEPVRSDIIPIFIVGLPRTGTTLVAELLARHPQVCNRGELNWISYLAEQLAIGQGFRDRNALAQAASIYLRQVRGDDAPHRYYIDKNPLNFRHVGLIAAMFPNARIIHCCRDPRDTALSIWSQLFDHPENAYAYDFEHIEAFMQGHERLMAGLGAHVPMMRLQYETLVVDTAATLGSLAGFVGLDSADLATRPPKPNRQIGTASVWQARQPVYMRGVARWVHYVTHVPELAAFSSVAPSPSDQPEWQAIQG